MSTETRKSAGEKAGRDSRGSRRSQMIAKGMMYPLHDPEADGIPVVVTDISLGGVSFRCRVPLVEKGMYQLRMTMGPLRLDNAVEVVWCKRIEKGFAMGSRFVTPTSTDAVAAVPAGVAMFAAVTK